MKYCIRQVIQWGLALVLLAPGFSWGHGAVDIPLARQVKCKLVGGVWGPIDGSGISDLGCRDSALVFATSADRAYPLDQWHEVAKQIAPPDYNDDAKVRAAIPDGHLCSAADPKKHSLDLATPNWYKTPIRLHDGKMTVRLIGTQPHLPGFFKIYLSKAGYSGAQPLKWSDLDLVHEASPENYRTDWASPPALTEPPVKGFFQFEVAVPPGRTGNAVLFVRWQRIDPAGEGFYNCSDITIEGEGNPFPWFDKGVFVPSDIVPKVGERVRFRVFGHTREVREIVDEHVDVTAANLQPAAWGKQLADKLAAHANFVRVGVRTGNDIIFNPADIHRNQVYLANDNDSTAISIVPTPPVDQRPPQAVITGPSTVKSGQHFMLDGSSSIGYNGALRFQWAPDWQGGSFHDALLHLDAPVVTAVEQHKVQLGVYDAENRKNGQAVVTITVEPQTGGGHDPYVPGHAYKGGEIVTHNGVDYQCKPFPAAGWCGQAPASYEPGKGSHWTDAWDLYVAGRGKS